MLQEYFETVLDSWNAIQFAVQQQTGGAQSYSISKWMNQVTTQFFDENKDLEPEEVADFLNTIMDQELNTLVNDGSDLEISKILCNIYNLEKAGNTRAIEALLLQIPRTNTCDKSKVFAIKSDSDDEKMEMETTPQEMSSQMSSFNLMSTKNNDSDSLATSGQNEEEMDGWTIIRKGKKKR